MSNSIAADHRSSYRVGIEYVTSGRYVKPDNLMPIFAQLKLDDRTDAFPITR